MTTRKEAARRVEKEIENGGVPPHDNQAPSQEQVPLCGKALVNPPIMSDGEISATFLNLTKFMDNQAQVITTQAQAMMTQANREVAPHVNQNSITMASRLRDFSRMNPPMFIGSKVNEYPQEFLDEVFEILYAIGVSSNEKAELVAYQLKDKAQTWYTQLKDNKTLRAGPMSWEAFRRDLLDRFFPRDEREA